MKILRAVLLVLLIAVVAVLALAGTKPDHYHIERSATIAAAPAVVFAQVNDFRKWGAWSPWEKLDPAMKRTYGGPASGKGANYAWEGSSKVGAGRMEIVDSASPGRIQIQLDFLKPFEAHNTAEFTLQPKGDVTHVTWAMFGPSPFISKVMGLFFSMDAMIGKDFATGLANLKSAAES